MHTPPMQRQDMFYDLMMEEEQGVNNNNYSMKILLSDRIIFLVGPILDFSQVGSK